MNTDASMQAYLNSLSPLPGAILYRDTREWKALLPGLLDQILTVDSHNNPSWQTIQRYFPALMQWITTSDQYSKGTITQSGDTFTLVARFSHPPTSATRELFIIENATVPAMRVTLISGGKFQINVYKVGGTQAFQLRSVLGYADDLTHYLYFSFNTSTAAFTFKVDYLDADDTTWGPRIVSAGSFRTGAGHTARFGNFFATTNPWAGRMGCLGWARRNDLNIDDFMYYNGLPKPVDILTWPAWGNTQPPTWHESGKLDENRGSLGFYTKSGGILLADPLNWG